MKFKSKFSIGTGRRRRRRRRRRHHHHHHHHHHQECVRWLVMKWNVRNFTYPLLQPSAHCEPNFLFVAPVTFSVFVMC
jgi:hypothetical protein